MWGNNKCACRPSTSGFLLSLWSRYFSTTSCPLPLKLLGPNKGDGHWQLAPFRSLSYRFVHSLPHGCVGRSCREMERMVLVLDGTQCERANICLVGPIQTLLQPSGITVGQKNNGNGSFHVCTCLRLSQTVSTIFSDRSTVTPSTWWLGSMLWVSSSVRL